MAAEEGTLLKSTPGKRLGSDGGQAESFGGRVQLAQYL